jgi:5-methyltetrahydrofolate--homocysteine methyltransferase
MTVPAHDDERRATFEQHADQSTAPLSSISEQTASASATSAAPAHSATAPGHAPATARTTEGGPGDVTHAPIPPVPRPADLAERTAALHRAFAERVLVMDGATGTAMQAQPLTAEDFGGPELEGCNENLCATRPDVVDFVHETYLAAGADIVETNTFGGTPLVLAEYGLAERTFELNRRAGEIARAACRRHDTPERPRFVAGSIGPTTKAISVTGGVTFEELVWNFYVQVMGLMAGGADYLVIETQQDTRNIKAALLGCERAFDENGWELPVAVSATIETMGTMLGGQDAEGLVASLMHWMPPSPVEDVSAETPPSPEAADHPVGRTPGTDETATTPGSATPAGDTPPPPSPPRGESRGEGAGRTRDLLYLGLNCATGPEYMTDHLRTLAELSKTRLAVVPNAGLPDENGCYHEGPDVFREVLGRFLENGWLNLVGGCCGTTAEHVSALADLVQRYRPRDPARCQHHRALVSGLEAVELTADNRPLFVGERTNVLGSRKFKRLIQEGDYEAAAEVGRAQVRAAAQVIDVCLQDPDRDEVADMEAFLDKITRLVKVPLMIDSTDAAVMERALTWCQGKGILNSINLEDGLERFEKVLPLAKRYGAALVVGLIDEKGMAVTVERKMEVARRSYRILTEEWGIPPEDLWFDPLVFPCGTGDEAYLGSAKATIEAVRRIDQELPLSKTILGISNVSFGLPDAGREVLNSVFLYHNTKAGLDAAIVNTEKLARYAEIPAEERALAERLLELDLGDAEAGQAAVDAFAAHFRGKKSSLETRQPRSELELAERLARAVVEGSKEGLIEDLDLALADERWPQPLDIINGPLMAGMSEVGRLFNDNELIVAEVLQSAEVMKAAVGHLERFMEKAEGAAAGTSSRGKVILATVKGDVHDIGKNLVDIILTNNGYQVINLGIKVPSETLVQAIREHQPDIVGLSGLLVKSAQQMVVTAADFKAAGIDVDLLVGGAALTRKFTHKKIAAEYDGVCTYAKDAMHGLSLVEKLLDRDVEVRSRLLEEIAASVANDRADSMGAGSAVAGDAAADAARAAPEAAIDTRKVERSAAVPIDVEIPPPPDFERHLAQQLDLDEIWEYVNPQMLYGKHLGVRGSVDKIRAEGDARQRESLAKVERAVEEVKAWCRAGGMKARAVWQWFPAEAEGNWVRLYAPGSVELTEAPDGARRWTPSLSQPDNPEASTLLPPGRGGSPERGADGGTHVAAEVVAEWELPRQAAGDRLCIADYVLPGSSLALFVTTAGTGEGGVSVMEQARRWREEGDYLRSHALAALALETAEAAAEWLHARMRREWGLRDPEGMSKRDLFSARYAGKRYSFGYPACPDLSGQRALFAALEPGEIGVELTEGEMMDPEASVSAVVVGYEGARYFGA